MADNVAITAGSGTTIAADDVGAGVLVQRVKATWGPDGTANDTDVATGKPMPVQLRSATGTAADLSVLAAVTATANALDINLKSGGTPVGTGADSTGALVTFTTEGKAQLGSLTESAPASDTASSGQNGRLQRIAQRITSMIALLPTALGRTTQGSSLSVVQASFEYEPVAASQTDQILGATGGVGDYLEGLLCVVATAATSQVQIKDGNGSAITVLPNAVGSGVGTYYVPLGFPTVNATTPGWKVTTAAGVSVIGSGKFT